MHSKTFGATAGAFTGSRRCFYDPGGQNTGYPLIPASMPWCRMHEGETIANHLVAHYDHENNHLVSS